MPDSGGRWQLLVIGTVHAAGHALLAARPDVAVTALADPDSGTLRAALARAEILLLRTSRLDAAAIAAAPRLRLVSRHGVGWDNVDAAALTARRIPLAVVGDANSVAVAEHAMFLLLAAAKQAIFHDRAVRAGRWADREAFRAQDLAGRVLLVVGLGRIGREVAARARAFGMEVMAHDPLLDPAAFPAGIRPAPDLDAALGRADAVSLHVPLTPATRGLLGAARIAAMRPGALLVSTARGGLLDEAALAAALAAGRLAGAGLDVFEAEPPAPDHPLLALPNVVLSPHVAGLTAQGAERLAVHSVRNVLDWIDGRLDPARVVNPEVLEASP